MNNKTKTINGLYVIPCERYGKYYTVKECKECSFFVDVKNNNVECCCPQYINYSIHSVNVNGKIYEQVRKDNDYCEGCAFFLKLSNGKTICSSGLEAKCFEYHIWEEKV